MFSEKRWRLIQLEDKVKIFAIFFSAFLILIFVYLMGWPKGDPIAFGGSVQSVGLVSVSGLFGGNAQGVTVKLDDGRVVSAVAGKDSALFIPGDRVVVYEHKYLLFWPDYGIDNKHR